jgi:hypothetical protein
MILPNTSLSHTGAYEFTKYEDFVKDIQDSFNTILSDVPENQKNLIREKFGLNRFPYLGNAIKQPGVPVERIGGGTQPTQQEGGKQPVVTRDRPPKPGMILVKKKVTDSKGPAGAEGWISPEKFDSRFYEKVSK